ncbi:MAG: acetyl-CoA C-acetyltransferase, partial [Bacteroidota bacterium]|nr:acetyl-CoA C-acetyltransferase [Bacteroidota bacterium]
MKKVVIVSAVRTPIGSFGGKLKDITAPQLGAIAIKDAVEKAGISPQLIDEVIMGCVLQANVGQAPARQASMLAGLPDTVIATTVNKVCASGMKAVALAAQSIMLGDAEIIVAGGMESMSNVPFYATKQRWGNKYGDVTLVDGLSKDGLTDVYKDYPMGNAAELCAQTSNISRKEQDEYAIESYKRSQQATEKGLFSAEIVPVSISQKKGDAIVINKDEEPFN